ncbi:uncharacterized protein [Epargyreus clarus]|uniref:uncharacterized protein isoform X3 n=1 Tax=Epargyreus clarus TaxID=520877 RepID=UPI003C2AAE17
MESAVHATVPLRVGKKMRKRRELDALVSGAGARGGRLLSASSDEGEPWARRSSRRRRSRPFVRLAAALAFCVCVVSAATVLWLFVDVRRQIISLRAEMDRVSTSSASVGDAIQICHMTSKELSANTTELSARLSKLELQYQELSKNMEQATKDLTSVMDQLAAAPKFADMPKRLGELQITVADFGSKMQDFERLLQTTKTQAAATSTGVDDIKAILHELEVRTNDTIANVTNSMKQEDDLKGQVASLNDTLVSRVDALQMKIEQINKQMSTPAPPTPAPLTSSTVSSTTAVNNATAAPPPPAPPANKPNVLQ